jgi:hypothetical protein
MIVGIIIATGIGTVAVIGTGIATVIAIMIGNADRRQNALARFNALANWNGVGSRNWRDVETTGTYTGIRETTILTAAIATADRMATTAMTSKEASVMGWIEDKKTSATAGVQTRTTLTTTEAATLRTEKDSAEGTLRVIARTADGNRPDLYLNDWSEQGLCVPVRSVNGYAYGINDHARSDLAEGA